MSDLKLDTTTHDLDLTGDTLSLVDGIDAIRQHLAIRLQMFLGEWFLDTRVGIPYFESILVKDPDLIAVRSIYRQAILGAPGVISLGQFELLFDTPTRKLTLNFEAVTDSGETLEFREFIINV